VLLAALTAAPLVAEPRFEVLTGRAEAGPERLEIAVRLVNHGSDAIDVNLSGELQGVASRRDLGDPVPGGHEAEVRLDFPSRLERPGLHAVLLRIASRPAGSAENDPMRYQLSYLGFPLGASPAPAFELEVDPARIGWSGELVARLRSLEGTPHRVALRLLTAPGLRAWPESVELELPAGARRVVPLGVLRTGARPDTRHGVLIEARVVDGPLERTRVVASEVEVGPERGRVPRLRIPLLVLSMLLLAGALGLEAVHLRR
jgi:hypothetical protein